MRDLAVYLTRARERRRSFEAHVHPLWELWMLRSVFCSRVHVLLSGC